MDKFWWKEKDIDEPSISIKAASLRIEVLKRALSVLAIYKSDGAQSFMSEGSIPLLSRLREHEEEVERNISGILHALVREGRITQSKKEEVQKMPKYLQVDKIFEYYNYDHLEE